MAITKQINYQVNFNANTQNVQNALSNLQTTLTSITNTRIVMDDGTIRQAVNNAKELQQALQNATNVNTGKLDISKFSQQLKAGGKDLSTYASSLSNLGAQGRQAFMQLTQSLSQAQLPLRHTNRLLTSLWTNLKNVAKWQISSTILMGFTSSISNAVQYTKDLNKNLNDIRIVSGQSASQMEKFAESANKAAKALSASTNEYTKAALIYYQQGLNDQQVKERTDATIKMANVTGESADDVSSYMTAIWNNFDNGSKSLEYYADVMTALGAATASSTDEIATGLEKFAGIAETVGLSYEYATSALATLVAQTRQSPETVGTALKTIFSRLQGLKLGETLDDGTSLNKYSEALLTVGINIKNSNGELKDMDVILNELGNRWDYIGKAEKMALAQTVGGIRQYTQLITLMDNWDEMQKNVGIAMGSTGELDKQAEIYAQSWEAASERTKASLEALYSELVPEDLLISLTDTLGSLVDATTGFVEGFGGIVPILNIVIGLLVTKFLPQLLQGGMHFLNNLHLWSGAAAKTGAELTKQAQTLLQNQQIINESNMYYKQIRDNTIEILKIELQKYENQKNLTTEQQNQLSKIQDKLRLENQVLETLYKQKEAIVQDTRGLKADVLTANGQTANSQQGRETMRTVDRYISAQTGAELGRKAGLVVGDPLDEANSGPAFGVKGKGSLKFYREQQHGAHLAIDNSVAKEDLTAVGNIEKQIATRTKNLQASGATPEQVKADQYIKQWNQTLKGTYQNAKKVTDNMREVEKLEKQLAAAKKDSTTSVQERKRISKQLKNAYEKLKTSEQQLLTEKLNQAETAADTAGMTENHRNEARKIAEQTSQNVSAEKSSPGQKQQMDEEELRKKKEQDDITRAQNRQAAIQGVTSAMSGMYMMMQSIQSLGSIWKNDDLSMGEKLTSTIMSLSMVLGGYSSIVSGIQSMQKAGIGLQLKSTGLKLKDVAATGLQVLASKKKQKEDKKETATAASKALAEATAKLAFGDFVTIAIVTALLASIGFAAGTMVSSAKKQNNKENLEKTSEKANEVTEGAKQNQDLTKDYKTALKTYKETGEGKEALAEAAMKVAEAYGLEAEALKALNGDYDQFDKSLNEAIITENKKVARENRHAMSALDAVIYDENGLEKGRGGNWGSGSTYSLTADSENLELGNIFDDYKHIKVDENGLVSMTASTSGGSTTELIAEMSKARDELEAKYTEAELVSNDLYQQLNEKLSNVGQENVEKALQFYNSAQGAVLGNIFIDNKDNEVKDMASYESVRNNFISKAKEEGISEKDAISYFELQDDYSQYHTDYKRLQETESSLDKEKLKKLYDTYGSLVFDAAINLNTSEDQIKQQLEIAQRQIDDSNLTAQVKVALQGSRDIVKALEEGNIEAVDKILNDSTLNLTDEEKSAVYRMSGEEASKFLKDKARQKASQRTEITNDDQSLQATKKKAEEDEKKAEQVYKTLKNQKEKAEKEHNEKQANISAAVEGLTDAADFYNDTYLGTYNNEKLYALAESMGVGDGLTKDSDEDDIAQAILDKINKENNTNIQQEEIKYLTDDNGLTYLDTSVVQALKKDFDSTNYDNKIKEAEEVYNKATAEAVAARIAAENTITDELYKELLQQSGSAQTFEELEIAYTNIDKSIGDYWGHLEKIVESSPALAGAAEKYKEDILNNDKAIKKAQEELYALELKATNNKTDATEEEIKSAKEELRFAKERRKEIEETFRLYNNLVNYKQSLETGLEQARNNNEVKKSYQDIVNQGVPAYDSNNENLVYDYAVIAGQLQNSFGVDLTPQEVANNWTLINQILNDTTLTTGELTKSLIALELGGATTGEELKTIFGDELASSLEKDGIVFDTLASKINNFDFSKGNYDQFFNSLGDITTQAAVATAMVEAMGDAAPPELKTVYTLYKRTVELKSDGLSTSYWGGQANGIATQSMPYDEEILNYIENVMKWDVYRAKGSAAGYEAGDKAVFIGNNGTTIEIPVGVDDDFIEAINNRFVDETTKTVKREIEIDVDTTVTNAKTTNRAWDRSYFGDDKQILAWLGWLEDTEKAVEQQQSVIDSILTSEEDRNTAIDERNRLLEEQLGIENKIAERYKTNAKNAYKDAQDLKTNLGLDINGKDYTLGQVLGLEENSWIFGKDNTLMTKLLEEVSFNPENDDFLSTAEYNLVKYNKEGILAQIEEYYAKITPDLEGEALDKANNTKNQLIKAIEYMFEQLTEGYENEQSFLEFLDKGNKTEEQIKQNILDEINKNYENKAKTRELSDLNNELQLTKLGDKDFAEKGQIYANQMANTYAAYEDAVSKLAELKAAGASAEEIHAAQVDVINKEKEALEKLGETYQKISEDLQIYNEEIDKQKEKLEAIVSISESYVSILETIGERFDIGKVSQIKAINDLQKASVDMAVTNVKVTKEQRDAQADVVKQLDIALSKMEKGSVQYNQLLEVREEEASRLVELETELGSKLEESISKAAEYYENNIARIMETLDDLMAGGLYSSIEDLQTAYDRAEEAANRYLDTAKQDYELSKLRRTINQQINANTTEAARVKLRDVLEDIAEIEQNNLKMSEQDLKMLNAKYELYKAQIALEEAQNNKSQVRLQRNASGNWSYVFTADQGKIDEAAQKVEDAQYNIYSQSQEYLEEVQKNILELNSEWNEALTEIYEDTTMSQEEREKMIAETNKYYSEQMVYYTQQAQNAMDVLGITFEETTLGMISGFNSLDEIQKGTFKAVEDSLKEAEGAVSTYEQEVTQAMSNAGFSLENFGDTVSKMANPSNKEGLVYNFNTITKTIVSECGKMVKALGELVQQLNGLTKYNFREISSDYDKNTDYAQEILNLQEEYNNETDPAIKNEILNQIQLKNQKRNKKIQNENLETKMYSDNEILKMIKENKVPKFNTGGYTGEWGNEGRVAVLHQKELVLNKEDTLRILSAVEVARSIAGTAMGQIHNLANAFHVPSYQSAPQTLQQDVHIEASFPGVQSAFEIETALNNIINDVSQYAEISKK